MGESAFLAAWAFRVYIDIDEASGRDGHSCATVREAVPWIVAAKAQAWFLSPSIPRPLRKIVSHDRCTSIEHVNHELFSHFCWVNMYHRYQIPINTLRFENDIQSTSIA